MVESSRAELIAYLLSAEGPLTAGGLVVKNSFPGGSLQGRRAELSALDDESLNTLFYAASAVQRRRMEQAEAAQPFNQPYAHADFDRWAKMEYWTVDEGIALLLSRSPDVLAWDKVKHCTFSPVVRQFGSIREAAQRAVNWKTLGAGNRPGAFLAWAQRFEYPVPPELEQKVKKFGHFMGDWYELYKTLEKHYEELKAQYESNTAKTKATYDGLLAGWKKQCEELAEASGKRHSEAMDMLERRRNQVSTLTAEVAELKDRLQARPQKKQTGQREADTLRKLVIGLAMVAYGYDPKAVRSEVAAEIVSDLQKRGLTVSDDTVRKHLKECAELLPPPEAPERSPSKR